MTPNEAKRLKVGDLVWTDQDNTRHEGKVIEVGYCAVKIEWADLGIGLLPFDKLADIHRHLNQKPLTNQKVVVG